MADFPTSIYSPRTVENRDGVIYDSGKTKVFYAEDVNKATAEIVAIEQALGVNKGNMALDGWIPAGETWNYASATTFTISGVDKTSTFTKGLKLKLTNDSATKYFYVVSSSFSTNTTVTITGETDLASSAITNPFYSYTDCPQGFKRGEDWYRAGVYLLTNQTIGSTSAVKVEFDTEDYDDNNDFDISSNYRYVAPISGVYSVKSLLTYTDSNININDAIFLYIYKNGSVYQENRKNVSIAVNNTLTSAVDVKLEKGDYIEIFGRNESSSTNLFAGSNRRKTSLFIHFVSL